MKALLAAIALFGISSADAPMCGTAYARGCCKICHAGKACGDSCISRDKECHKGRGCACDG